MSNIRPLLRLTVLVSAALFGGCRTETAPSDDLAFCSRKSNDLVLRLEAEPNNLNPLLSTSGYNSLVDYQMFGYLLTIDPVSMELAPYLAKSRPAIQELNDGPYAGGMSYTYEIHEAAVWDNGTPVTGRDYAFTLKAVLNPFVTGAKRLVPYVQFIKDVVIDPENPKKFTVYTNERQLSGEERVSSTFYVIPEYAYDPEGLLKDIPVADFSDEAKMKALSESDDRLSRFADQFQDPKYSNDPAAISGCGAYKLESWEPGQQLSLVKKENWWGDPLVKDFPNLGAYPDRIIIKPIIDAATALTALKAEEIDVMSDINPKDFTDLVAAGDSSCYRLEAPSILQVAFLSLNTRIPKLSDKRVRKAIAYAIDVDQIINTLYYGLAERTASPAHPSTSYYNQQLKPIPFDIEKAKSLLAEAGWKDTNGDGVVDKDINGQKVELQLRYGFTATRSISQQIGLLIQENAGKAGIDIKLDGKEFNQLLDDRKRGDFDIIAGGRSLSPLYWEPKQNYHTAGDNQVGFGNADTDALLDSIQNTFDEAERLKMYLRFQEILYDEMPEIYVIAPKGRIAIHKRFEGPTMAMYPGFLVNLFHLKESAN